MYAQLLFKLFVASLPYFCYISCLLRALPSTSAMITKNYEDRGPSFLNLLVSLEKLHGFFLDKDLKCEVVTQFHMISIQSLLNPIRQGFICLDPLSFSFFHGQKPMLS